MTDNDNVIPFNGITKLDIPPERVLKAALVANLTSVIVIGWDEKEDHYFASSIADGAETLWLVEMFKKNLLEIASKDEETLDDDDDR